MQESHLLIDGCSQVPFLHVTEVGLLTLYSPLRTATVNRSSTVLCVHDSQAELSDRCRTKGSPPQTPQHATAINHTAWKPKSKIYQCPLINMGSCTPQDRLMFLDMTNSADDTYFLASSPIGLLPTICIMNQTASSLSRQPVISSRGPGFFQKNKVVITKKKMRVLHIPKELWKIGDEDVAHHILSTHEACNSTHT